MGLFESLQFFLGNLFTAEERRAIDVLAPIVDDLVSIVVVIECKAVFPGPLMQALGLVPHKGVVLELIAALEVK